MKKILLAIPTSCFVESETVKSLYNMQIPDGYEATLEIVKGYAVHQARNILVDLAIKGGFDYVFWIDADVILPDYILSVLLNTGKDIVCGYYHKKIENQEVAEIFGKCPDGSLSNVLARDLPKQPGVYQIGACGFGCTLTSVEVFKKMLENSDTDDLCFDYIYKKNAMCSEDILFCQRAEALGYITYVHTGMRCGHIGQRVF